LCSVVILIIKEFGLHCKNFLQRCRFSGLFNGFRDKAVQDRGKWAVWLPGKSKSAKAAFAFSFHMELPWWLFCLK
jgi:hypothetical protein